jgi:hypothetical protein
MAVAAAFLLFGACAVVAAALSLEWACVAWVVLLPTLFVALAAPRVREQRRRRAGLCASCGYDRRDLAGDAPCPECGAK